MKTPFQAFVIVPARTPLLPSVTVQRCVVLSIMATSQMCIIETHSLVVSGRCSRVVPFGDLASTPEKAIEKASDRIRGLPALPIKTYSGPDEKTAAVAPLAGAGSE